MRGKLVHAALFGVAVGDALGVPAEFTSREVLKQTPVKDMIGFGSHNQPPGTWSDDSSLTFCLAESLSKGYDLRDIGRRFISWYEEGYWTPYGEVFDVGVATSYAIQRLKEGVPPAMAGGGGEKDNGNGSLMRILPILFYVRDMPVEKRFQCISDVSSLTHKHIRSVLACFIYIEFARQILETADKWKAFENTRKEVNHFLNTNAICSDNEINRFHRILLNPVANYDIRPVYEYEEDEIMSSGYVVHSLEAALWCIYKENNYRDTILKAVNLGSDTDTTAAIAGGLAGLLYGYDAIPNTWIEQLARKDDIWDLCNKLE